MRQSPLPGASCRWGPTAGAAVSLPLLPSCRRCPAAVVCRSYLRVAFTAMERFDLVDKVQQQQRPLPPARPPTPLSASHRPTLCTTSLILTSHVL